MYIINVVNVVVGTVQQAATGTLNGRLFKAALHRVQVSTRGVHFTDPEGNVTYINDDTLTWEQREKLAKVMARWQAEEDTIQYGLEFDLFMKLYLTPEERATLHAGETRFSELKVQQGMTDAERRLANAIQAVRQEKAVA